jgi:hypothetical protein
MAEGQTTSETPRARHVDQAPGNPPRHTREQGQTHPRVDGVLCDTPEARMQLLRGGLSLNDYRPQPVRRVYIPKSDGKQRPLGIPCVKDRVMQAVVKAALEPKWEARSRQLLWLPTRTQHHGRHQCHPHHPQPADVHAVAWHCMIVNNPPLTLDSTSKMYTIECKKLWACQETLC